MNLGFLPVLLRCPSGVGEGDDTGHTSWRSLNPFRVAAPGSAYRRGFRSPEAPTWRLHPRSDAANAANGGICGAAREASRRQRAPPRASRAGSCGGWPLEAARLGELEPVNAHPAVASALRALRAPGAAPQVREGDARAPRGGSRSRNRARAAVAP